MSIYLLFVDFSNDLNVKEMFIIFYKLDGRHAHRFQLADYYRSFVFYLARMVI